MLSGNPIRESGNGRADEPLIKLHYELGSPYVYLLSSLPLLSRSPLPNLKTRRHHG